MKVLHFDSRSALDPLADVHASFERFLQLTERPERREAHGLNAVLRHLFPAVTPNREASLEYVTYEVSDPTRSPEDCIGCGTSWTGGLTVVVRLVVWETETVNGEKMIRDVKEQEVFCGAVPLMTPRGTFIIDGLESVLVARRMNLWLAEDGLAEGAEVPRERVIGAGEWLGLALHEGFALLVAEAGKRMTGTDAAGLMPTSSSTQSCFNGRSRRSSPTRVAANPRSPPTRSRRSCRCVAWGKPSPSRR